MLGSWTRCFHRFPHIHIAVRTILNTWVPCSNAQSNLWCILLKNCAKIVTQIKSSNFQHILRVLLIKHYNDFPQRTLHGFLKILTIATSEAIAESQGSLIDALHLRYKNTDSDDRRVQKELQIRLMAPSPCSAEGEKLVQQVATRMARNHSFLKTTHGGMGAAIENFCKSQYRLPFKFW